MGETVDDLALLLEALYDRFGHDFRHYARARVKRRIAAHMRNVGYDSLSRLQQDVLARRERAEALVQDLTITVTEMFRAPDFHRAAREPVLPLPCTWPHIRIWHAGCATGEEVYSMAMLLKEAGLYDRALIYATDLNQRALERAEEGIYPLTAMQAHARNYQRSGATGSFSDHCTARYGSAIMDRSLRKNIVWAQHNLATDSDFAEVQL